MKTKLFCFISAIIATACMAASAVQIPLNKAAESTTSSSSKSSINIGYVDIEKVFAEHPMTKRMKEDFMKEADLRKKSISEMQTSINSMKNVIASSTTLVAKLKDEVEKQKNPPKPPAVVVSTFTVTASTTVLNLPGITPHTPVVNISSQPSVTSAQPYSQVFSSTMTIEDKLKYIKETEDNIAKTNLDIDKKNMDVCRFIDDKRKELDAIEEQNTQAVMKDIYLVIDAIAQEQDISVIFDRNQLLYGQTVKDLTNDVIDRLRGR